MTRLLSFVVVKEYGNSTTLIVGRFSPLYARGFRSGD
jgi:hypothetical protein